MRQKRSTSEDLIAEGYAASSRPPPPPQTISFNLWGDLQEKTLKAYNDSEVRALRQSNPGFFTTQSSNMVTSHDASCRRSDPHHQNHCS